MKKIGVFSMIIFLSAAAVAQSSSNDIPQPLLTSMVASSARLSDVIINPNPVKGENFNLELQNLDKGKYTVYAYDNSGKKYLLKIINIEGESSTQVIIDLPKEITSGTYILQVLSKNARFSKKMIVE